ncbi:MAG TPA: glycosyltransferase family 2 protein [Vicinamibacterales bacterium]
MTVAVLIVNWNGGPLLRQCLESLEGQTCRPDRVIVVDNGSTDDSLALAAPQLRHVHLIRLATNAGFAEGNNIAARAAADVDALALLNPDAVADPGWLDALVRAAEQEPTVAAFASQIRLSAEPDYLDGAGDSYHVSGRAWRNGHRVSFDQWPAADVEVFAPCAAAALYRREAFDEIGGFDPRFFCYFEDVDVGFRLRLRGHRCLYVHSAMVWHVSSALSGYRSDFAVYHGERNAVWTFVKNMPGPLFWLYLPQHVALNLAALAYYPWRRQGRAVLKAKIDALKGVPEALRQRRVVQSRLRADPWDIRRAMNRGLAAPYLSRYSASPVGRR